MLFILEMKYINYVYNKTLVENYKKAIKSNYNDTMLHLKYKD